MTTVKIKRLNNAVGADWQSCLLLWQRLSANTVQLALSEFQLPRQWALHIELLQTANQPQYYSQSRYNRSD
jgi:hypothetical protein